MHPPKPPIPHGISKQFPVGGGVKSQAGAAAMHDVPLTLAMYCI